jgi:glucose/arabinose dehydrogenase/PKD repeat protein
MKSILPSINNRSAATSAEAVTFFSRRERHFPQFQQSRIVILIFVLIAACVSIFTLLFEGGRPFSVLPVVTAAPGLSAGYGFSEAAGTTTADASGNGNTGTLLGSATWIPGGKYGSAIAFNGSSGIVQVLDSPTWKANGLTGYTVSLWVNVKNTSATYKVAIGTGSWPANDLFIYKDGSSWSYGLRTSGTWSCSGNTSSLGYLVTADNTYHYIALVLDTTAGRCDFYSDGAVVGVDEFVNGTTIFGTEAAVSNLHIGGLNNGQVIEADIDEVRIYTRSLSQGEIQTGMLTPVDTPPVDTTPPVISAVSSSGITQNAATITWTTNEASDTQVEYGRTDAYGSITALNPAPVTSHSQGLSGLAPDTLYHYRVRSKDAAGNLSVSGDFTFTTLPGMGGFQNILYVTGLFIPTAMEFAPDGRLFVAQKTGSLRVIKNGQLLPTPFLTVSVDDFGERGLLGIAFDPNFASNRYVYIFYSHSVGPKNRVSRFTASTTNPDVAEAGSELVILDNIPVVASSCCHNAGAVHFGLDGKLYVATGDGGERSLNSQDLTNLNGKILRINSDGTIPADNPFVGQAGARGEIWAYGFRNPFTFAVHPVTGRIFVNDVGAATWEEINELQRGANYGWPICEGPQGTGLGNCSTPEFTYPIHAYDRTVGSAVTGGAFYTASRFPAAYRENYFFGDYTRQWIRRMDQTGQVSLFLDRATAVDIKIGPDGALYYLDLDLGAVYKVDYASGNFDPIAVINASPASGPAPLSVSFDSAGSTDPDGDPLTYTWNFGDGSPPASGATTTHLYSTAGLYTATLTVSDGRGGTGNAPRVISVGSAPTATIILPPAGTTYSGGDRIGFSGIGSDPEDGTLPASAFSWTVMFHHDTHTHPFLGPIPGVMSGSFLVPQIGHTETNVWFRIHLTVTDSNGLQHSVFRDILPNKSTITLNTNIPGMTLTLDGQPLPAPLIFESVVGVIRSIGAPPLQTVGGRQYEFVGWSDGGAATHDITTLFFNTTYLATYQEVVLPPGGNGLVAAYNFNELSGTTVTDVSGNSNTGTLLGGATWTTAGKYGGALSFDGSSAAVRIADSPSWKVNGLSTYTISMWVKVKNPADSYKAAIGTGGWPVNNLHIYKDGSFWNYGIRTSGGPNGWACSGSTSPLGYLTSADDTYHHIAVVLDSANNRCLFYSDGVLVGADEYVDGTTDFVSGPGIDNLYIGGLDGGQYLNAEIDDVRIYIRALTQAEIQTDMITPLSTSAPP